MPQGAAASGFVSGLPALPLHDVSGPTELPSEQALVAWRAFLRAHAQVLRSLEAELQEREGIALADYDVLVTLSEAPGQALRMRELADLVLLSRSGVTRLVDRLVRNGYVARAASPDDLRGRLAVLTPAGLDRLRRAAPTHLRGVRAHFTDRFADSELVSLRVLMDRLG